MSFCQNFILPSDSEANRDGTDAESPFPLFFAFSAYLRTLAHKKRSENCLRFATSGPSFCLYPLLDTLLERNIILLPRADKGHSRGKKKNCGEAICSRHQQALSGF